MVDDDDETRAHHDTSGRIRLDTVGLDPIMNLADEYSHALLHDGIVERAQVRHTVTGRVADGVAQIPTIILAHRVDDHVQRSETAMNVRE